MLDAAAALPCAEAVRHFIIKSGCVNQYPSPEVWDSRCRAVMGVVLGRVTSSPLPVTPSSMGFWESSGRIREIGSSRVRRPASTHWRRAMVVMSLVAEPSLRTASSRRGGASGETEL